MKEADTPRQTLFASVEATDLGRKAAGRGLPLTETIHDPINILVVDDEPRNLTVLQAILDEPDYRLVRAESADQALIALLAEEFALLILDVRMPGMTGFELAQIIKERKKTARVPIIFLTAYYNEDQHVLEGYGAGAVDYLHKPVNAPILRSKVAVFAELHRKNREAVRSTQALFKEVEERRRVDEKLRELNETLEQRVAARTEELRESRARLSHAADLAKLTYFDLSHDSGRIEVADNFPDVFGFELVSSAPASDEVASGWEQFLNHIAPSDSGCFATETKRLEIGCVRKIEYRVIGVDGKERWIESEWHHDVDTDGGPVRTFFASLDITERKKSEEQKKILMAEINHRSKNLLAVVQALVTQSARGANPATFASTLADRLQGLAASQDLLIKSDWRGIEMRELVLAQLYHFKDLIGTRILFDGPVARLNPGGSQAMGMALHELATNAAKHGSLSVDAGKVQIKWQVSGEIDPTFTVQWTESGGPPACAPERKGFGHLVTGAIAEAALAGKVEAAFTSAGLIWTLYARASDALEAI